MNNSDKSVSLFVFPEPIEDIIDDIASKRGCCCKNNEDIFTENRKPGFNIIGEDPGYWGSAGCYYELEIRPNEVVLEENFSGGISGEIFTISRQAWNSVIGYAAEEMARITESDVVHEQHGEDYQYKVIRTLSEIGNVRMLSEYGERLKPLFQTLQGEKSPVNMTSIAYLWKVLGSEDTARSFIFGNIDQWNKKYKKIFCSE